MQRENGTIEQERDNGMKQMKHGAERRSQDIKGIN